MTLDASRVTAGEWGPWACGPGEGDKLTPIADLVRLVRLRGGEWAESAELVGIALRRAPALPEMFERRPGAAAYALLIADSRELQAAIEGKPAQWVGASYTGRPPVGSRGAFDGRCLVFEPSKPAVGAVIGPHGALALALAECAADPAAMPAALDRGWVSRLAIRTTVAAELFGHGLAPVAAIERPASMRPHAACFGHCRTWEARPRELWRAADVVLALVPPDMAPKDGMHRAVELLASVGPLDWFMLHKRGGRPRLVNEADVWRQRCPSGAEWLAERKRADAQSMCWLQMMGEMDADEAQARGCAVIVKGELRGPELSDADWSALPELPELRGQSGVIEWLHAAWADRGAAGLASMDDDGDERAASFLAVPAAAVAVLFAELQGSGHNLAMPLHLVPAVSVDSPAKVAAVGAAAVEWSPAELQTLVDAHADECRTRGDHGAPGRVLARWPALFPTRAACSVTRFKALLKKAGKDGITPTRSASWAAPVLPPPGIGKGAEKARKVRKAAV